MQERWRQVDETPNADAQRDSRRGYLEIFSSSIIDCTACLKGSSSFLQLPKDTDESSLWWVECGRSFPATRTWPSEGCHQNQ